MTVADLITRLIRVPQDADVFVADPNEGPDHWTTDMILSVSDTTRSLTLHATED